MITEAYTELSKVREGIVIPINPPSIPGLGTTGGLEAYIQAKGDGGLEQTAAVIADLTAKAKDHPELGPITSTFNASSQQLLAQVDRDKAVILGVAVEDVYSAMQTMFGSLYVSQFNKFSRLWQVIMQAEPSYRLSPDDLEKVYVKNATGGMVPLKAVVTTKYVTGPTVAHALQQFPGGEDHGQRRARLQLGPGDRGAGSAGAGDAAQRLRRSPGPARRSRRRSPAAPRRWCSCSAS